MVASARVFICIQHSVGLLFCRCVSSQAVLLDDVCPLYLHVRRCRGLYILPLQMGNLVLLMLLLFGALPVEFATGVR
jgi:hypothetical protein